MGMFDWIKIDEGINLPLPQELEGVSLDSLEFQTKSLDRTLSVYLISPEGLFLKSEEGTSNLNFHGIIDFGAYQSFDTVDYSIHYKAKFTDGSLSNIELCGFEEHFHESREKLADKLRRRQKRDFENSVFYYPQALLIRALNFFGLGFESRYLGFASNGSWNLIFYRPSILLFSKDKTFLELGFFLKNIDFGFSFTNSFYERSFCAKVFGFGLLIRQQKEDLLESLSNISDEFKNKRRR